MAINKSKVVLTSSKHFLPMQADLIQKIQEVRFVDTQTGKVLHTYKIGMEEK